MKQLLTLALSLWLGLSVAANPLVLLSGAANTGGSSAPTSPVAGYLTWYKADAGLYDATSGGSAVVADGATVARWEDQSANVYHATQATSGERPILKTGILNGKPVLRFSSASPTSMQGTSAVSGDTLTVFAVLSHENTSASFARAISMGVNNTADFPTVATAIPIIRSSTTTTLGGFRDDNLRSNAAVAYGTAAVICSKWDATNHIFYVNGVAATSSASTGTFAISALRLGRNLLTSDPSYFSGDIAEVIVYTSALNSTDRQAVEDYLGAKYGITITH